MRPITSIPLMLLTSFPYALGQDYFLPRQTPGCQYPALTFGTYIYATSPAEPNFSFAIYTRWTHYYADLLRAVLPAHGFTLARDPAPTKDEICGWTEADHVTAGIWERGVISYKSVSGGSQAAQTAHPHAAPNTAHHQANAEPHHPVPAETHPSIHFQHLAASLPHRIPRNETLTELHKVLTENAPAADIAFFMLEVLGPLLAALSFVYLMIWLVNWTTRCIRRDVEEECGDIELSSIQGQSMSHESFEPCGDPQKPDLVWAKNEERFFTASSKVGGFPLTYGYAVDGAGR